LTGYVWGENIGWVSLNCSNDSTCGTVNYKVSNTDEGTLSGYAWSENTGWINFNPTFGGVSIDSSGNFSGHAWGENTGWIVFNCTTTDSCAAVDYKIKTDWRPRIARLGGGGGGGGGGSWTPLPPPPGGFLFFITPGVSESGEVTLYFDGGPDAEKIAIADNPNFDPATYMDYATSTSWTLSGTSGEKKLYVRFFDRYNHYSEILSRAVVYQKKSIVEKIKEAAKKIVEGITGPKPTEPPEVIIEEIVSREAPLVFQGKWWLLPRKPIREFVLAPLPKAIMNLAQKFPTLEKTFKEVGISKITDITKLKDVALILPGLTERSGLPIAEIEPGKFAPPRGVPVANLSLKAKQQLPMEIVFAKTGGELIDFNPTLSVTEEGELQSKISTISGRNLQLAVKPDKLVKSVRGYVVFKSKKPQESSFQFPFNRLAASLIFANPVFAHPVRNEPLIFVEGAKPRSNFSKFLASLTRISSGASPQERPVEVEEKLVLLEFEYTDPDGDGIYTAEIQAPMVEGEYEIITVIEYEDPDAGARAIRLITVVDPEGYVYEQNGDKETRVPGAIVSLFFMDPETKQYELWSAKEYQQENPQTTNVRGTYSFLVPNGLYYLKVETPGYLAYDGKPFDVREGSGIHINIELKTKYWWLQIVDWKTILLAAVMILLLYNFYRDKIRERLMRSKNL